MVNIRINKTDGQNHRVMIWQDRWTRISFTADQARQAGALLLEMSDELRGIECDKRQAHNHDGVDV